MKAMLEVCTPTSITYSGTSASITADGGVEFTGVTTLSLNGCFTADYDNYMIDMRFVGTGDQRNLVARLRSAGIDSTSNYTRQYLITNGGSTIFAGRTTSQPWFYYTIGDSERRSGVTGYLFGPFLSQPTALRTISSSGDQNARYWDEVNTHSLSSSYDGISIISDNATFNYTGLVTVFGLTQ